MAALDSGPARRIRETGGPTTLQVGAIPDTYLLKRSGSTVVGVNPSSVSPVQVVQSIVVSSDRDTVSFTGLDGDADGYYILNAKIISGSAVGDDILLRPQGSDTNMSATTIIATSGGSLSCSRSTPGAKIGALYIVNGVTLLTAEFFASKADGIIRGGYARSSRADGVADNEYLSTIGYNDNSTKITQLDIFVNGGTGTGIKAGSVFTLSKFAG